MKTINIFYYEYYLKKDGSNFQRFLRKNLPVCHQITYSYPKIMALLLIDDQSRDNRFSTN